MGFSDWFDRPPKSSRRAHLVSAASIPPEFGTMQVLDLPEGQWVRDDKGAVVGWITTGPVEKGLWQRLMDAHPTTGLWPVAARGLGADIERPWLEQELTRDDTVPAESAEPLLNKQFHYLLAFDDDDPEELDSWRGLAPASTASEIPLMIGDISNLLLVPVARAADVPWRVGWTGPVNYELSGTDVSTVLRSWEERFGATLVEIGFDTLTLLVRRRIDKGVARWIAHEHLAFCPDNASVPVNVYKDAVLAPTWHFWWD